MEVHEALADTCCAVPGWLSTSLKWQKTLEIANNPCSSRMEIMIQEGELKPSRRHWSFS